MRAAAEGRGVKNDAETMMAADWLVDVWLAPGDPVPFTETSGRLDFRFRILAVCGIDPEDPQWGGDLEEHIRAHYQDWVESAETIEI